MDLAEERCKLPAFVSADEETARLPESLQVEGTKIKAGQVQFDFPVVALADSLYLRSVFPGQFIALRKPYLPTSSSHLSDRRRGFLLFGSGLCALSSSYVSVRCILHLKDLYSCFQCLPIQEPLQTLLTGLPCSRRCTPISCSGLGASSQPLPGLSFFT